MEDWRFEIRENSGIGKRPSIAIAEGTDGPWGTERKFESEGAEDQAEARSQIPVNESGPRSRRGNEAKQSHCHQPLYGQLDTLGWAKRKPRQLSSMASIAYGDFDPVFSQIATDGATLYIADSGDSLALQRAGSFGSTHARVWPV